MDINKLNNALITNIRDKYNQIIEINDVVLYSNNDTLADGVVKQIFNDSTLYISNQPNRLFFGKDVMIITKLFKDRGLSISLNNEKLKKNNNIYILYCIYNDIDGFIFFKPQYTGNNEEELLLQNIKEKYKDIIMFPIFLRDYSSYFYYFQYEDKFNYNIEKSYNVGDKCFIYTPLLNFISQNFYWAKPFTINIKMKYNWYSKLTFELPLNEFIPFNFSKDNSNLSLTLNDNSYNIPNFMRSFTAYNFYETLRLLYKYIIPKTLKIIKIENESNDLNCYFKLNNMSIKNKYI